MPAPGWKREGGKLLKPRIFFCSVVIVFSFQLKKWGGEKGQLGIREVLGKTEKL